MSNIVVRRFGILATISQNTMLLGSSCRTSVSVFSSPAFTTLSNSLFPPISRHWISLVKERLPTNYSLENPNTHKVLKALSSSQVESNRNEVEFQVVTAVKSSYNDIVIVDTPESRMLLLDSTYNVHSIFNKGGKWTGSYWDEFASLPAIVTNGPIAIFGLGGGTAAHLMLDLWPSLQLEGWEIDEILIDKAREYLGLSDLEKHTQDGGVLQIRVGDALAASSTVPGGYAAIVIDLFSDGKVLPQLKEVETWLKLNDKLMPNGRFMVNCGGADNVSSSSVNRVIHPDISSSESTWEQNSTIKALCKAFPGEVSWKKMLHREGENYLALTGPLPDFTTWSAGLPDQLRSSVMQWKTCSPS